ncbi:MAG: hypothetical protein NC548_25260 [Lachnospiraceae bacterium]|nr:hypothetical protein [Lachnospiraceae bacterium]
MVLVLFCINFIVVLTVIKVWDGASSRTKGAGESKKYLPACAFVSLVLALLGI